MPTARARLRTAVVTAIGIAALAGLPAAASPAPRTHADPGGLPQTHALPSAATRQFRARMAALWHGIVTDSAAAAMPAFFPRGAYLQVKQIPDPASDYRDRLLTSYRADIRAAHELLGSGVSGARLLYVSVPREWAWIPPGYCYNRIGYWHAPGSRLVFEARGHVRSFGIFSLISWRGQWYVVHLAAFDHPGTVYNPSLGPGSHGPAGGC
jgi:hypothetical protein